MRSVGTRLMTTLAISCTLVAIVPLVTAQTPYDVVIEGGRIVDGTGNPWYHGDVGIRDGRIETIGDLRKAPAARRINATGHVVAPGFVDIHTHADEGIEKLPLAQNYMQQGVTTVVGGNCGGSIYPVGEKLTTLEKAGLGINFALLVGQGTIRQQVMGMADRAPIPVELTQMEGLVARAMEQGAVGLSTGLYYAPGSYSSTAEVIALARVAARYGGIYTSHIRDESDYTVGLVAAVKEAIDIGENAKLPAQVSHLKALGKPVWGKSTELLSLIDAARARGVDAGFDQYPYVASGIGLIGAAIPRWAQEGGEARMRERLRDPVSRERIKQEMADSIEKRGGPEKQFVAVCSPDPSLEGKHLAEIGKIKGKDPMDAAIDLLIAGRVTLVSFNMLDDDLIRIMQSPLGIVGSDGSIVEFGKGVPHPRYYGTFPRVLGKYVREEKVLSLEEAVRKMTSAPARRIGLGDRGLIREGMAADITVFNPATVADKATFQNPHQYPSGIESVLVNGQIAVLDGKYAGVRAGKVLYRQRSSSQPGMGVR